MVLPQRHRLRGKNLFDYIYKQSRRYYGGSLLVLRVAAAKPNLLKADEASSAMELRLAVVISSKVSKRAVQRNRLRRQFHQSFVDLCHRWEKPETPCLRPHSWLLLSLKPAAGSATCNDLLREWLAVLQQAGFLDDNNTPHHPSGGTLL
ncbi:MAG: ribonuclease P protein component [Synechococcaceae bacterium WBA_2_066]|nr:ribonuclease P protein component [Synechococcaceae bacterium WB6_1A_059]NBP32947.1 ribonuclease P protein component [Synechococcaceae bacterium WB6_1B_055]NBP98704.1 ribonuclease P protein component [Synechococcaceae bacterium WB6_3A_227]NBQ18895.1 ribonuclease P protein component [Synechococcaceae bacterium WB5_2A_257]NBR44363.1 ribonuclease P protein component [Synechococcaceae bacterium WB5_2B_268]NBY60227.1 ribonuclease P protein component [Synechococcaceae bacterium LLD_019]NCU76170.1